MRALLLVIAAAALAACSDVGTESTHDAAVDGTHDVGTDDVSADGDSADVADTDVGDDPVADATDAPDGDTPNDADTDVDPDARVEPEYPAVAPELAIALADALAANAEAAEAPGVAVGVVLGDGSAWYGAWGTRSTFRGGGLVPHERFRVGSITKTFVASLVVEASLVGDIDLDAPVADSLPSLGLDPRITPRMLLNHTSGIIDYTDDEVDFIVRAQLPATPEEVIAYALSYGPVFAPGEGWHYSNTGYFVLGLLLEQTHDTPFGALLRSERLDPLGLANSFLQPDEDVTGGYSDGHTVGAENTDLTHMSWAWAAGGTVSNTHDLCRWAGLLFGGDVVPADAVAEMTAIDPRSPANEQYGLGIRWTTRGGRAVAGHTGSTIGFRGELFRDPVDGTCVAVLTNDFFATQTALSEPIWQAITAWQSE